jgi:hypothetical protein
VERYNIKTNLRELGYEREIDFKIILTFLELQIHGLYLRYCPEIRQARLGKSRGISIGKIPDSNRIPIED